MTFEEARTGSWDGLPEAELAFPGPLRDALVAAILSGEKTSTTGLRVEYERDDGPLPEVGDRSVLVDSRERPVAVLETTGVRLCRLGEVDLRHALDEGEGHETVAEWRAAHERFWSNPEMLEELGDPEFRVSDDTEVVLERFVCHGRNW